LFEKFQQYAKFEISTHEMLFHRKMKILTYPKVQQTLLIWIVSPSNYPHFISHSADEIGYSFVSQHVYSSQHKFRWTLPRCKHRSISSSFLLKSLTHLSNYHSIQTRTKTPTLRAKNSLQLTTFAVACVKKKRGKYTQVHNLAWESRNTSPTPVCAFVWRE